jgi:hypothetical protein
MSDIPKTSATDIIRAGGVELTTAADLYGASIDRQIATAKHYPRNLTGSLSSLRAMVTSSVEIAESCEYALPRDGKQITGASARFAEILAYAFGNIRVEGRIIEIDKKHVTAQGVCHDLETNLAQSIEVKRRITNRSGQTYNDDMIQTTCQAAISIARRNAILACIPEALWADAYEAAQEAKLGTKADLPQRIKALMEAFEKLGVAPQRVLKKAGYESADEFTTNKLAFFRSLYVAIKENHTSVEEQFPREDKPAAKGPTLDDLASHGEEKIAQEEAERQQQEADELGRRAEEARRAEEEREAREAEKAATSPAETTPAQEEAPAKQDLRSPAGSTQKPLAGGELKALVKSYLRKIERFVDLSAEERLKTEISGDPRLPDTDSADLIDALDLRIAEIKSQAAG